MKYYRIKVKIIFNKKSVFHDKEETHNVYVAVPSNWKKCRAELTAIEKVGGYVQKRHPRLFKKKAYKLVTVGCEKADFVPTGAKFVFRYND